MKRIFMAAAMLLSSSIAASEFNGYIVKLKNKDSALSLPESIMASTVRLNTSFGAFVHIDLLTESSTSIVDQLKNHPDVSYVEKNWIVSLDSEVASEVISTKDQMYSQQWGLKNTGLNSGGWFSSGKAGEDVNAERAWEIQKGSEDIIVAVIDTGIDHRHPDLQENLWVNQGEIPANGIDDDGNGYIDDVYGYDFANADGDPMDGHSHGTHCAGVIGAAHNGAGVMGVMKNVKLMGIKFLTDRGSGETIHAIESIDYAIKNGAHIMSNSWGGGERSEALKEAIESARDAGILFVAAAGNSSSNNDSRPTYPANYEVENVITVGAMDGKGNKASFSNYGRESVHVFAPGVNILSTVKNGGYQKMSGTSMATPMVSGVLGLLLSNEPGINILDAKERLMQSTVNNSTLSNFSMTGRVDAHRMLTGQSN